MQYLNIRYLFVLEYKNSSISFILLAFELFLYYFSFHFIYILLNSLIHSTNAFLLYIMVFLCLFYILFSIPFLLLFRSIFMCWNKFLCANVQTFKSEFYKCCKMSIDNNSFYMYIDLSTFLEYLFLLYILYECHFQLFHVQKQVFSRFTRIYLLILYTYFFQIIRI